MSSLGTARVYIAHGNKGVEKIEGSFYCTGVSFKSFKLGIGILGPEELRGDLELWPIREHMQVWGNYPLQASK